LVVGGVEGETCDTAEADTCKVVAHRDETVVGARTDTDPLNRVVAVVA
jgi:hypothetical protein